MKKSILLALAVATAATVAVDANARKPARPAHAAPKEAPVVAVDVPPPSGNWEAPAPAAQGYVWSKGYYEWKDGHYAWKPGEWVLAKEGMEYRQYQWVQRPDKKWILTGGDWVAPGEHVAGKQ
jgi:hypothetical protein